MPIEVKCPKCEALLRVPDEYAGRQARCPKCSEVFTATAAATSSTSPTPFGAPAPADPTNPYTSPTTLEEPAAPQESSSEWAPRLITTEEVFSKSWAIFKKQWLMGCAAVLIVGAINFGMSMVQNIVVQLVAATTNEPEIIFGVQIVISVVIWFVQIWLGLGQMIVFFDIARGREVNFGRLFAGGPFWAPMVLAIIVIMLLSVGIMAVLVGVPAGVVGLATQDGEAIGVAVLIGFAIAMIPLIIVGLIFSQIQPLIIDRGLGAIDALKTSYEITSGNKLTIFLIGLLLVVISIAAAIVGFLALCIGIIPAMIGVGAFGSLVQVVTYLCMTGQQVAVPAASTHTTAFQ